MGMLMLCRMLHVLSYREYREIMYYVSMYIGKYIDTSRSLCDCLSFQYDLC